MLLYRPVYLALNNLPSMMPSMTCFLCCPRFYSLSCPLCCPLCYTLFFSLSYPLCCPLFCSLSCPLFHSLSCLLLLALYFTLYLAFYDLPSMLPSISLFILSSILLFTLSSVTCPLCCPLFHLLSCLLSYCACDSCHKAIMVASDLSSSRHLMAMLVPFVSIQSAIITCLLYIKRLDWFARLATLIYNLLVYNY